ELDLALGLPRPEVDDVDGTAHHAAHDDLVRADRKIFDLDLEVAIAVVAHAETSITLRVWVGTDAGEHRGRFAWRADVDARSCGEQRAAQDDRAALRHLDERSERLEVERQLVGIVATIGEFNLPPSADDRDGAAVNAVDQQRVGSVRQVFNLDVEVAQAVA